MWHIRQNPLNSYDETLIECSDCEKRLPRYRFPRNRTRDGERRCVPCLQCHNANATGVFWNIPEGGVAGPVTPGMCTIQFAQQEYWSITSKLDLGIKFKVKKEHLSDPEDPFEEVPSRGEQSPFVGNHWANRPGHWDFHLDAFAQTQIVHQQQRIEMESQPKDLVLPATAPKKKVKTVTAAPDPNSPWGDSAPCDPNAEWGSSASFVSGADQDWANGMAGVSKLVQTSRANWGLHPKFKNKARLPEAVKTARDTTIKLSPVVPDKYRD